MTVHHLSENGAELSYCHMDFFIFSFFHLKEGWLNFKFESSVLPISYSKLYTSMGEQDFKNLFLEYDVIIEEAQYDVF